MPEPSSPWKIVASEVVIDTPYLRLRRDSIETPRGEIVENFYVRETRGFVIVFALSAHDEIVLVHQYKHGIAREVMELPAGAVDEGEKHADAAARELREETGYVSSKPLELVREFITDPTNSNGTFWLYLARDVVCNEPQDLDPTEEIRVELVTTTNLRERVRDGRINVGVHVAAIYTMLEHLDEATA